MNKEYKIIVIEGAGSPSEINLKSHDIVNLKIAKLAKAPVILVGDIDKGGVFAWLVGTLQLMTEGEKRMIKGIIINKFRGDKRLLASGIRFLQKYTGIKVLGIIPYFRDIKIPQEDSLPIEGRKRQGMRERKIRIDVVCLPHISNFTDFDALSEEPDVALRYIRGCEEMNVPDVIIIPGTKNTIDDLDYLRKCGLAKKIISIFESYPSVILVGICGGYQILGEKIYDRENIESKKKEAKGLGVLSIVTQICPDKILSQVKAKDLSSGVEVKGYRIHQGRTKTTCPLKSLFEISQSKSKRTKEYDGTVTNNGRCWGTYIHGLFDNDSFRRHFLNGLRKKKGWKDLPVSINYDVNKEIDKLACLVRNNLNLSLVYKILFTA